MNSRITVVVLAVAIAAITGCANPRSGALDQWATSFCAVFEELDREVVGPLTDAQSKPVFGRREAMVRYAEAVREAEEANRQVIEHFKELGLPPADAIEFHKDILHTFELFGENLAMLASDLEVFLETGDMETLEQAQPSFVARDRARLDVLDSAINSIRRGDVFRALTTAPGCDASI